MVAKFEVQTEVILERAILVGIDWKASLWPLKESLDELERLVNTAGAEVVGRITQKLDAPNARTFIGAGKAEELVQLVKRLDADLVVFDDELTPSQQNNIEKLVGKPVKVIDRTALILDIFALHATTKEGKLQVRLAQNQYLYPRLRGMWSHLASNRMGGGVGSRFGEGESQLEVDRRLVRNRIANIKKELNLLASNRLTQRKSRQQSGIFRIALAGYTNAGKSSLMNCLTNANILAYDKLFATLDSTTRQLILENKFTATLTDTVGFIQKLPTNLVEAFKSTLDEIREANLLLLVVDSSSKQKYAQLKSVQEVLAQINAEKIPRLVVFNKIDLLDSIDHLKRIHPDALFISATTGEGIDELKEAIVKMFLSRTRTLSLVFPYTDASLLKTAHEKAYILEENYLEDGIHIVAQIPSDLISRFSPYKVN